MAEGGATCRRIVVAGMDQVADRAIRRAMRAAADGRSVRGRSGFARCAWRLRPRLDFAAPRWYAFIYLKPAIWAWHCFSVSSGVPDASMTAQSTTPMSYFS